MAADIYNLFRGIVGDSTSPYSLPDLRALKYLDEGIRQLSRVAGQTIREDITLTTADIDTNKYKDLTYNITSINPNETELTGYDLWWEVDKANRIRFIEPDNISEAEYTFVYTREYLTFDGTVRENDYFDYPRQADLAIVLYAIALYEQENGIIKTNGAMNFIKNKSEDGLTLSFGSPSGISDTSFANPNKLQVQATMMMRNLPNSEMGIFSV